MLSSLPLLAKGEMRPRAGAGLVASVRGCDLALRHVYARNPALVRSRSGWTLGGLFAALAPYWGCFFPPVTSAASKPKKGGQPGPQTTMKGSNMNVLIDAVLYFLWWIIIHLIPQASKFTPQVSNFLSGLR